MLVKEKERDVEDGEGGCEKYDGPTSAVEDRSVGPSSTLEASLGVCLSGL